MFIIDPIIFLISLCIGLFYVYLSTDKPEIIIKYPSPYNTDKIVYTDKAGMCYKYAIEKVLCPLDKTKINSIKIQ